MRDFIYSYSKAANTLSQKQLRQLGKLVSSLVEKNSDLENAVATCFLEHLHQAKGLKLLWPYLSEKARAECYP